MSGEQVARIIGPEQDQELWRRVIAAAVRQGARITDTSRMIGGAQDVDFICLQMGAAVLRLERENCVGITLRGDADLLARVAGAAGLDPA